MSCQKVFVNLFDVEKKEHVYSRQAYWLNKFSQFYIFLAKSKIPFWVEYQLLIDIYRTGSSAIDFTQLGHRKSFGTKYKTDISNSLSFFYLVPKHFRCPNWVKSIADDPALKVWKYITIVQCYLFWYINLLIYIIDLDESNHKSKVVAKV